MARVFTGERTFLDPVLGPDRAARAAPDRRRSRRAAGLEAVLGARCWSRTSSCGWRRSTIVTLQQWLPLNPDGIGNMEPTLAFNTISSFTTNTNLQHYSGETGLSYFSQMFVITFLQFVTAATGVAACVAIIRGLAGNRLTELGNFYVDLTRATVRVFLPLALARVGPFSMWQGTPMTFEGAAKATTLEGQEQTIARGVSRRRSRSSSWAPTAAATSARTPRIPYENPTPLSNFVETWSITDHPDGDGLDARLHGRPAAAGGRDLRDDAGALHADGGLRRRAGGAAATRRSRRWASISRPDRWRARRSGSAPGSPRSGR